MKRETKDSGIPWIGEIPKEWYLSKYKFHSNSRMGETILKENLKDEGIPVYSATQSNEIFGYVNQSSIKLHKGDFVIPARGNSIGFVSIVEYNHATCSQTTICSYNFRNIFTKFLYFCCYGLKDYWFEFDNTAIPQITVEQVKNNALPLPPFHEQKAIAEFLDRKCGEIDELLSLQEKMIEELKAYKQAIITETVTKGLNQNITFKDSGIEWIGEIPKHWNLIKTLYILEIPITDGPHETPTLYDDGIPFISAEAVSSGKIDFNSKRGFISKDFYDYCCQKYVPRRNDIYMIKSGATTGKTAIVETDEIFTIWSPLAVFRANPSKIIPRYLLYMLRSNYFQKEVENNWSMGTQQNIGMRALEKIKSIVPPLSEQKEIADFLDKKCSEIDNLIELKQQKIEELKDYKKSIIYEYVTGKKQIY